MVKKKLENEVSKYLDALVGDYQKENCNPDADYLMSKDDMLDFATYFVNWQKEQLIKEAIDGIARPNDGEVWCDLNSFNFKDGDKVKVIIIMKE